MAVEKQHVFRHVSLDAYGPCTSKFQFDQELTDTFKQVPKKFKVLRG